MESRLLLNVVVRKSAAVLELLARENKALLVRGNALLVLNLGLDVVNGVGRLDLKGNGLASESLHENLHVGAVVPKSVAEGRSENKLPTLQKSAFYTLPFLRHSRPLSQSNLITSSLMT